MALSSEESSSPADAVAPPSSHPPITRSRALLALFIRHPHELVDVLLKDTERHLDALWSRPPAYPSLEGDEARNALCVALPATEGVWAEQALHAIEGHVVARQAELRLRGPWGAHYDADLTLARALYVLCRALRPSLVVETGVAYGLSSAFLLQALHVNGHGELHSIDLPPLGGDAHETDAIGALVPRELTARWGLYRGSTRRLLPRVLAGRNVDLFVQDSSHTYLTVRHEFDLAWRHLRPGGALVCDDIECSQAFDELRARRPAFWGCYSQQDKRALFGIAIK